MTEADGAAETLPDRIRFIPEILDEGRAADCAETLPGDLPETLRDLVLGVAGASPYLAGLIRTEGALLSRLGQEGCETVMASLLAPIEGQPDAPLRRRKRQVALLTALADIGGAWRLQDVTGALSDFADFAVETAIAFHLSEAVRRGHLPEAARTRSGGLFVLAMGKMGARELNYSSDIDLICLFDETRWPPGDYAEIRAGFVRVVKGMMRTLSGQTGDGYVLRTDLRLRPDPSVTPVCIGMNQAETYYESLGRTWERAAMIKARPCAGDLEAGQRFLADIRPFIWRRQFDFAAIADTHDMQRRIRDHKGLHGPVAVPGHDVKLGRGGIRTIEFFAQTRQLICGGREPELRLSGTVPALRALYRAGWIPQELAEVLERDYVAHRGLEHRIQMLEDAQTHVIPKAPERRLAVAMLCGFSTLEEFDAAVETRFEEVERLTEAFFAQNDPGRAEPVEGDELEGLGYRRPELVHQLLDRWHAGAIPATRSDRARAILKRIEPEILRRLAEAASPDDAFARFDAFLSGLPAGVQILSLFEANPQLLDLLAEVCAASPRLAEGLARHPEVLDSVLDRSFFAPFADARALRAELEGLLAGAGDYERVLDAARRWTREVSFRIGVQLLRGVAGTDEAGKAFSNLAQAVLQALLPHVEAHFAIRFGPPPGKGAVIVGMGKLGSEEMTISSDLDLIVIYDPAGETDSSGPRSLSVPAYYARLTQALVSALSSPTAEGVLYEVDMRLRPSGRQGPVAVAFTAFETYQREEAWAWEHMALTRARVLAGPAELAGDVTRVIAEVRAAPRDAAKLRHEAAEMRARLARAHAGIADRVWEVKQRPGGMMDIELLVQTLMLEQGMTEPRQPRSALPELVARGALGATEGEMLGEALALQSVVQHYARLAMSGSFTPEAAGQGLVEALTRATGDRDLDALRDRLGRLTDTAAAIVAERLGSA